MPSHRILFALSFSVSLHLVAFGITDLLCRMQRQPAPQTPAVINATLRMPAPKLLLAPLLKDTLAPSEPKVPPKHPKKAKPGTGRLVEAAAQRKLAKHVYYPEAAIAAGIQGEVHLLLTLDENGAVKDARIADSSGHAILDQAAIRAAYSMGSLPGLDRREIILPVTFRLQP
jgi:protein TonB